MSNEKVVELGDRVRDRVTGFEGVVLSKSKWLHNVDSIGIQKQEIFAGKVEECFFLDETPRIEILEKGLFADTVIEAEKHDFKFLDEVQDTITSFRGKITGFTTWSSGCVRVMVSATKLDKDNKPIEMWLPVAQIIKVKPVEEVVSAKRSGGPMNHPKVY